MLLPLSSDCREKIELDGFLHLPDKQIQYVECPVNPDVHTGIYT